VVHVIGWDIGGANVKAARLEIANGRARCGRALRRYVELWKGASGLSPLLREIAEALGPADAMVVTMTAELVDLFGDKREGVAVVLSSARDAFSGVPLYLVDLDGRLVRVEDGADRDLLDYAATNWIAEALVLAQFQPDGLLVDIGSTTTDLIPVVRGRLAARGRRDLERLSNGELVYTGVLRTPVSAIVSQVPLRGAMHRVSSEFYAIAADVHLVLGDLPPEAYTCATPDQRGKTRAEALARLARIVCEDRSGLRAHEIVTMAAYIAEKQAQQITDGMLQVLSAIEREIRLPVVPVGIGGFLARSCARRLRLDLTEPPVLAGEEALPFSACVAAAYLLGRALG
jgi:hypothetical protein